jgi:hypothetical protein
MVVVTMRGRWTIKRKEKEKKSRRRGREEEEEERTAGGERVGWAKGKFIYPSGIFRHGRKSGGETIWWWLGAWTGASELVQRLCSFRHDL